MPTFREDFFFVKFITCKQLKAAVGRGMNSWAANSVAISFTDVTEECKAIGQLNEQCPLAELWVTASKPTEQRVVRVLQDSNTNDPLDIDLGEDWKEALRREDTSPSVTSNLGGGIAVATAKPKVQYATGFRFTNGVVGVRPGVSSIYPNAIEVVGARLTFNTEEICWYLDSTFCASFHSIKRQAPDLTANNVHWIVRGVLLTVFLFAFGLMFINFLTILLWSKKDHKAGLGGACHAYIDSLARKGMCGMSFLLILLILPPVFYTQIFLPCWECYDFEAAATHEVGHVLGFSHPDTVGERTLCKGELCGKKAGQNVYASNLEKDGRWNNVSCLRPWEHVKPGVPPGSTIDDTESGRPLQPGEVRPSVMLALTQHNPSVCLSQDDLEGLNVLYPSCSHPFTMPVCDKVAYNIGWVRLGVWVLMPLLLCLIFMICLFSYTSHTQNKRLDHQIKQRMARSVALQQSQQEVEKLQKSADSLREHLERQKSSEADRIREEVERELAKRSRAMIKQIRASKTGERGMVGSREVNDDEFEDALSQMPRLSHADSYDHHFKGGTLGHAGEALAHQAEKAWEFTRHLGDRLSKRMHDVNLRISHRGDGGWRHSKKPAAAAIEEDAIAEENDDEETNDEEKAPAKVETVLSTMSSSSSALAKARMAMGKSCKRLSSKFTTAQTSQGTAAPNAVAMSSAIGSPDGDVPLSGI